MPITHTIILKRCQCSPNVVLWTNLNRLTVLVCHDVWVQVMVSTHLHSKRIFSWESRDHSGIFTANKRPLRLAFGRGELNPFLTNVTLTDKPGSWFLLAKYLKNICGRVTF